MSLSRYFLYVDNKIKLENPLMWTSWSKAEMTLGHRNELMSRVLFAIFHVYSEVSLCSYVANVLSCNNVN